jgi:DNA-binding protein
MIGSAGHKAKTDKKGVVSKVKEGFKTGIAAQKTNKTIGGLDNSSEDEELRGVNSGIFVRSDAFTVKISSNGSKKAQDYTAFILSTLTNDTKPICLIAEDKAIEKLVKVMEQVKAQYSGELEKKITLNRELLIKPNAKTDRPIMQVILNKK